MAEWYAPLVLPQPLLPMPQACWGSHVLARLEIPKDETTSNHFQTSGPSPPGSREGSLYDWQRIYVFEVQRLRY